jgi:predicted DNA-binding transcriptional regulator AlpA
MSDDKSLSPLQVIEATLNGEANSISSLQVIDEREAANLNGVSLMTWLRMRQRGETPPAIQISKRRIGYRLIDIRQWQESRRHF